MVAARRGVPEAEVGYEDVARAAFGRAGQVAVSVSMYTELYGICAVLFIVMVRNLAPFQVQISAPMQGLVTGIRWSTCDVRRRGGRILSRSEAYSSIPESPPEAEHVKRQCCESIPHSMNVKTQ